MNGTNLIQAYRRKPDPSISGTVSESRTDQTHGQLVQGESSRDYSRLDQNL